MPRKPTKNLKRREGTKLVTVAVSQDEIAAWDAAAERDRRDRSSWLRTAAREKIERDTLRKAAP